jgi:hypothetical protein
MKALKGFGKPLTLEELAMDIVLMDGSTEHWCEVVINVGGCVVNVEVVVTAVDGDPYGRQYVSEKTLYDVSEANKKLILHAAFYAVALDDWKRDVFTSAIDKEIKIELMGKFPGGDPMNNLLNLASRLMPDFDENAPINDEIKRIKKYIYNTPINEL